MTQAITGVHCDLLKRTYSVAYHQKRKVGEMITMAFCCICGGDGHTTFPRPVTDIEVPEHTVTVHHTLKYTYKHNGIGWLIDWMTKIVIDWLTDWLIS